MTYNSITHLKRIGVGVQPHVLEQVACYLKAQAHVNERRPDRYQRQDQNREHLAMTFTISGFYGTRDARGAIMDTDDVRRSKEIKERLMKGRPNFCNCGDGRCLTKIMWGFHGHTLRYPGGESKEFHWDSRERRIYLPHNTELANVLRSSVDEIRSNELSELQEWYDSHFHCAARKAEEEDRYGTALGDTGLYYDLVLKMEHDAAIGAFLADEYGDAIQYSPYHTAFDPETGGAFMGLERHLSEEWIQKNGFTEGVLNQLVADGGALSTEEILVDKDIKKAFSSHIFDLDYEWDYDGSSLAFWTAIETMIKDGKLDGIQKRVTRVYPDDNSLNARRRALLLATNVFTRYLLREKFGNEYPYRHHTESIIVKTLSEYGPYGVAHAASLDPTNRYPSKSLRFFADLVRSNRKKGHMSDPEKDMVAALYGSYDSFVNAPVPLVTFRRVPRMDLPELGAIRATDWSDLALEQWQHWGSEDLEQFVLSKLSGNGATTISTFTLRALTELMEKAQELYGAGLPATDSLVEGRIINLPTLAGPKRETIAIFPFISAESA